MLHFLLLDKPPSHAWLQKNCDYEAQPLFFPRKNPDYLNLLYIIVKFDFFSNIFTKPYDANENSQPCMTSGCPLGKSFCLLKQ